VDRACATNAIFDHYASQGTVEASQLVSMIKGIFAIEKLKSSRPPRKDKKANIIEELEKQLKDERAEALGVHTVPYDPKEEDLNDLNIMSMSLNTYFYSTSEATSINKNEPLRSKLYAIIREVYMYVYLVCLCIYRIGFCVFFIPPSVNYIFIPS
jgi:membrane-bound ClpP family serine protease